MHYGRSNLVVEHASNILSASAEIVVSEFPVAIKMRWCELGASLFLFDCGVICVRHFLENDPRSGTWQCGDFGFPLRVVKTR